MKEERERMSEDKRKKVADWIKQQIAQNNFNCTMKPSSDARLSKKLVWHIKSEKQLITIKTPHIHH